MCIALLCNMHQKAPWSPEHGVRRTSPPHMAALSFAVLSFCLLLMGYHLSAASFSGLCLPKGSLSSSSFSPQSFCSVDGACGSRSSLPPHLVLLIPPHCRHSQSWPRILPACQTLTHHTFHHCALECLVTLAGFLCLRSVFSGAEAAGV